MAFTFRKKKKKKTNKNKKISENEVQVVNMMCGQLDENNIK